MEADPDPSHVTFCLPPTVLAQPTLATVEGTFFDPKTWAGLSRKEKRLRCEEVDTALHALGPKYLSAVYSYFIATRLSALPSIFSGLDLNAVSRYFLKNAFLRMKTERVKNRLKNLACFGAARSPETDVRTNSAWRVLKLNCAANGFGEVIVQGVAGFLSLISNYPQAAEIDDYFETYNAKVAPRERLSLQDMHDIFRIDHFRLMKNDAINMRRKDGDAAALFDTTVEFNSLHFRPKNLSNGATVFPNQAMLAINQACINVKMQRLSVAEWGVLSGLLQEQLLEVGNSGGLNIRPEQHAAAVDLLRKLFEGIQTLCAERPEAPVMEILDAALEQLMARHLQVSWQKLYAGYDLGRQPMPNPCIAEDRKNMPQKDLAKQFRFLEWQKAYFDTAAFAFDTMAFWLPEFLEALSGKVDISIQNIGRHDEVHAARAALVGSIDYFSDKKRAAQDNRPVKTVPVQRWNWAVEDFERHLYIFPALMWNFMKIACGAPDIDPALLQIWGQIGTNAGFENDLEGFALKKAMFDLSLEELRKNAQFKRKDLFFSRVADQLAGLQCGNLNWDEFSLRLAGIMAAWEENDDFGSFFDENDFLLGLNKEEVEAGIPGALENRDRHYTRSVPASEALEQGSAQSSSGSMRDSPLANAHRRMQQELLHMPAASGAADPLVPATLGRTMAKTLFEISRRAGP